MKMRPRRLAITVLALLVLLFLSAAGNPLPAAARPLMHIYDFLAHFSAATVETPDPAYVHLDVDNLVLFEHPVSQVTFPAVLVRPEAWLEFGVGLYQGAWERSGDGVRFVAEAVDEAGQTYPLYARQLDPYHRPEDRHWFNERVDLRGFSGQNLQFVFRTEAGQTNQNDWAAWTTPRIVSQQEVQKPLSSRPNILFISIDTLRADHLSSYGYPRQTSPILDRLAEDGVLFAKAYSQSDHTLPSHATMLTGLYPRSHGVTTNRLRLSLGLETIPERLQKLGYHTVGMVSAVPLAPEYHFDQGFDEYFECPWVRRRAGDTIKIALDWLSQERQDPFFMWIHLFDVHAPYVPPQPYNVFYSAADAPYHMSMAGVQTPANWANWYDDPESWPPKADDAAEVIAQYDGAINYTDAQIARVLAYLDELGVSDQTIVIVTADHGEGFGEHAVVFCHFGVHEETVHVPLIMRVPGRVLPGQVIEDLVGHVDLGPTLFDLLNEPIPPEMQGLSLLPLMEGRPWPGRAGIISQQDGDAAVGVRTPDWRLILQLRDDPTWPLYIVRPGQVELYDLRADAGEQRNLWPAKTSPAQKAEGALSRLLAQWEEGVPIATDVDTTPLDPAMEEMLRKLGY